MIIDRQRIISLMCLFLIITAVWEPLGEEMSWGAVLPQTESVALGEIGAGKLKRGIVVVSSAASDRQPWFIEVGEGWSCKSGPPLAGTIDNSKSLQIRVAMKSSLIPSGEGVNQHGLYTVVLNLEVDNRHTIYNKKLTSGHHREVITLRVGGERKVVELSFTVIEYPMEPLLSVLPRRLDFGTLGQVQKITRKIEITNRGRQALKWKINRKSPVTQLAEGNAFAGRYVSFLQSAARGTGQYQPGGTLKDAADFNGHWSETDGYPEAHQGSVLKCRFSGSGLILYYWKSPAGGKMTLYLDNRLLANLDTYGENNGEAEYRLNDVGGPGSHLLTLVNNHGRVVIEGIRINGKELSRGRGQWIKIFPELGVTTREIDYLHVTVDTARLSPGIYGHVLNLESNGGEIPIEIYAEVSTEAGMKILDVYRYSYGNDILFSTNPQGEAATSYFRDYRKQGIAFRLFSPGTPGTTEFYRWYNPHRQLHFYAYAANANGKLSREFLLEGSIGNIATSRLPQTRELYRWYHPSTGHYFFCTDPKGESVHNKGYKYDGIAGFVR